MRSSPYLEKPADYTKAPDTCAFRWCTKEAVTSLMVIVDEIYKEENDNDAHVLIYVCPEHRDLIERNRNKRGAR